MILRLFLIIIFTLSNSSILLALETIENDDTLLVVKTKHGELRIDKEVSTNSNGSSTLRMISGTIYTDSEVIKECEDKEIFSDIIVLKVIPDKDCQIISIKVETKGKIERFNSLAELFCEELFRELTIRKITDLGCSITHIRVRLLVL
jgi:capsular polysaccharide biosynthesis protein